MYGKNRFKILYNHVGTDDSYFRPFAEFLMAHLKYQPGKTLFAAPYDWRHNQKSGWFLSKSTCVSNIIEAIHKKDILIEFFHVFLKINFLLYFFALIMFRR
jgi:hypothetical protein